MAEDRGAPPLRTVRPYTVRVGPFITEVRDSRKTNLRTSAPPRPQTSQGSVVQEIKVGHTLVT